MDHWLTRLLLTSFTNARCFALLWGISLLHAPDNVYHPENGCLIAENVGAWPIKLAYIDRKSLDLKRGLRPIGIVILAIR
ncbi:MAG: hypothetical protein P8J68_10545 [Arenicellaceae bacterium]|nr:hypothetical protein [Arenicellaceae bacterium]